MLKNSCHTVRCITKNTNIFLLDVRLETLWIIELLISVVLLVNITLLKPVWILWKLHIYAYKIFLLLQYTVIYYSKLLIILLCTFCSCLSCLLLSSCHYYFGAGNFCNSTNIPFLISFEPLILSSFVLTNDLSVKILLN